MQHWKSLWNHLEPVQIRIFDITQKYAYIDCTELLLGSFKAPMNRKTQNLSLLLCSSISCCGEPKATAPVPNSRAREHCSCGQIPWSHANKTYHWQVASLSRGKRLEFKTFPYQFLNHKIPLFEVPSSQVLDCTTFYRQSPLT